MGEADACGVLLGLSGSQLSHLNDSASLLELILLSESLPSTKFPLTIQKGSTDSTLPSTDPWTTVERMQKSHIFIEAPEGAKILNVMLIEWNGDIAERVAVGQVSSTNWELACPIRKTIVLG